MFLGRNATSGFEQRVLANRLTAEVGGEEISVSPIEEQIAYKLRLAQNQGSTTGKDFEDLGVIEYYDELRNA